MKVKIICKFIAASAAVLLLCGCSKSKQLPDHAASAVKTEQTIAFSEQESRSEALYIKAVEEENALHYTYAKELFSQIMDYKDADAHYGNLIKILLPYNGTYYMYSEDGNEYTITINDGIGEMVRGNLSGSVHTLNLYGMYFRDVSDEVCMVFDVNLGKEDWNYSGTQKKYILEIDEQGDVNIQGVDGNHEWDASGIKTD